MIGLDSTVYMIPLVKLDLSIPGDKLCEKLAYKILFQSLSLFLSYHNPSYPSRQSGMAQRGTKKRKSRWLFRLSERTGNRLSAPVAVKRAGDSHLEPAQLGQPAQAAVARITGIRTTVQVGAHLVSVVGAPRNALATLLLNLMRADATFK